MGSKPTVLISAEIQKSPIALKELRLKLGSFRTLNLVPFDELMEPLYDSATDIELFIQRAEKLAKSAIANRHDALKAFPSIGYVAVDYEEVYGDSEGGIDGRWYLEKYLLPRIDSATSARTKLLVWQTKEGYWA